MLAVPITVTARARVTGGQHSSRAKERVPCCHLGHGSPIALDIPSVIEIHEHRSPGLVRRPEFSLCISCVIGGWLPDLSEALGSSSVKCPEILVVKTK